MARKKKREKSSKKTKNRIKFKQESNEKVEVSEREIEGVLENVEEMGRGIDKEKARALRKERERAKAKRALDKYNSDSNYRLLFDCTADFFADYLKSDIKNLNDGKLFDITLAAKWCPSIDSSYDKATLIFEAIGRRVFPRESEGEYQGLEEAYYAYRVRDRLRKQVLVPLHKALELPEVYMSANKWNTLPYNRVASVAMKNYKALFTKHDNERFQEYLEQVKTGNIKIAAGALLPHEIIGSLEDKDGEQVAELQWKRMVNDVAEKGKLTNCIAVCDVSGSMSGIPMEVSVALGLLVSELSEEPWKGKVITFSANPELHLIKGDTLKAKIEFVRNMEWGGNTDFQKVFDQILAVAVEGKLSEEQLIKRVFVFSDMEFDDANGSHSKYWDHMNNHGNGDDGNGDDEMTWEERRKEWEKNKHNLWKTDYEVIQQKFHDSGYKRVPEIVFWNLRNC
ncbi:putative Leucine-rich repeat receptor-like protein kinase family protein [Hibiscus syriacus]|uniref:Leucine-rich repeat receptor-like protein kinase family protein n=1 Tax=Hibiscus syriacus TaxID=106335 RepID=A0A6A2ZAG1_HIBSY|nr:putative Leucine-rich repeat receptor-like protein kinase family protein [Hibiscus syriacus]